MFPPTAASDKGPTDYPVDSTRAHMLCDSVPRPDFPRTLAQFQRRFASEEACRAYLAVSRWPDGYRCPRCGYSKARQLRERLLWRCRACGHDTSVTAGTVGAGIPQPAAQITEK